MKKITKGLLPLLLAGILSGCELMPGGETPTVDDVEDELSQEVEDAEGTGNINTTTPQGTVGQALTASNGAMYNLSDVDFTNMDPSNYFMADEGYTFLYCTVQIQNNSSSDISYSPSDWRLVDEAGRELSVSSDAASGVANEMVSGTLPAGGTLDSVLSFEVPDDQHNFTLYVYGPLIVNVTPLASWTITR